MTLRKRYQIIKSDKILFAIFCTHILLAFSHLAYSYFTVHYQCYIRAGFCAFISICTFFFLRKGFSISILLYAYVLLYFNNFWNYTSFLFVLFAIYCTPKLQPYALIIYIMNVFIAFSVRDYKIITLGIHSLNCLLFYFCAKFVFTAAAPKALLLTDDERAVLSELAAGKLQKQIELFSQNTITKLLKNAQMRNQCKSKTELMHKFLKENPAIESQEDCESIAE